MKFQAILQVAFICLMAITFTGCSDADGTNSVAVNGSGTDGNDNGGSDNGGEVVIISDGVGGGTVINDDLDNFPVEGMPGTITENGVPISGNFFCATSAQASLGASTEVGADQLIGGPLTDLLNTLGGTTATDLLNSVQDKDLVIDGFMSTFSTFALTAGGLTALDSVDQSVLPFNGGTVPAGGYAVFALSFPTATLQLSIIETITVSTFLADVEQETVSIDANALDLLNQSVLGENSTFLGLKTTLPYDRATISLHPTLLSINVGDAMHVHEMCTRITIK